MEQHDFGYGPSARREIDLSQAEDRRGAAMPSASMAPEIPAGVAEQVEKRRFQLQTRIKASIKHPELDPPEAMAKQVEEWQKTCQEVESPLTIKAREKTLADWSIYVETAAPALTQDEHWLVSTIKQHATGFLYFRRHFRSSAHHLSHTKKNIKARTLVWWAGLLLYSIVTYGRNTNGEKSGLSLLVQGGLYKEIKVAVINLIQQHNLDRHADKRIHFGRAEIQLIIHKLLERNQLQGRQLTSIQSRRHAHQVATPRLCKSHVYFPFVPLIFFYQYPRLSDLTIFCMGMCDWEMDFCIRNFKKAIGTSLAMSQTFRLTGVLCAHNALFDIPTVLMAHLWMRGAFKTKYKTPEELFQDVSHAQIELDPNMLDQPLFLASIPGGREFLDPLQAAMSRSFYDGLRYWAQEADLPGVGYGALRRDTGNLFGLQMGRKYAEDVLNHARSGPFRASYSLNMQNLNLVNIRLGEVAGIKEAAPGEKLKVAKFTLRLQFAPAQGGIAFQEHNERHMFASYAVEALVRSAKKTPMEATDDKKTRATFKDALKNQPPLKALDDARQAAWSEYLKCFTATASGYQLSKPNANTIFKRATGEKTLKQEDSVPLVFQTPWTAKSTEPVRETFLVTEAAFLKEQTKLLRRYDMDLKNKKNWEILDSPLTGTPAERRAQVEELMRQHPSKHIEQAVKDSMASISPPTSTNDVDSIQSWAKNLDTATATTIILEQAEELEDEGDADNLFKFLDRLTVQEPAPEFSPQSDPSDTPSNEEEDRENEDTANAELAPNTDETTETDIFKIPMPLMRRYMFNYLVQPFVAAREYEKCRQDDGDYHCPKCLKYTHRETVPDAAYPTISKLERHLLMHHSEWDDLELQMVDEDLDTYHCPAGDFANAPSVKAVRVHAVSDCIQVDFFRDLERKAQESRPNVEETRTFRDKRQGRSNVINGVAELEDDGSDHNNPVASTSQAGAIDLNEQVKDLITATVTHSSLDQEAAELGDFLEEYLDHTGIQLQSLARGRKPVGQNDWDSLNLDSV
ncbi:hypothetical protein R3P38DRAFT_3567983 [Favolaschia claudopus]|uniref:Uncharacterized protein n=1 Tax=Favolaschia claudopus TaxID=2862362 RepID=A0AAW0AUJ3_9AGAR